MRKRAKTLTEAGVQVIVLLALNDDGAPGYDHQNASYMATLGIPGSAGVLEEISQFTIALPFNDTEVLQQAFSKFRHQIACVIVEPVMKEGLAVDVKFTFGNINAVGRPWSQPIMSSAFLSIALPPGVKREELTYPDENETTNKPG